MFGPDSPLTQRDSDTVGVQGSHGEDQLVVYFNQGNSAVFAHDSYGGAHVTQFWPTGQWDGHELGSSRKDSTPNKKRKEGTGEKKRTFAPAPGLPLLCEKTTSVVVAAILRPWREISVSKMMRKGKGRTGRACVLEDITELLCQIGDARFFSEIIKYLCLNHIQWPLYTNASYMIYHITEIPELSRKFGKVQC